jgi:hypothetical protein
MSDNEAQVKFTADVKSLLTVLQGALRNGRAG